MAFPGGLSDILMGFEACIPSAFELPQAAVGADVEHIDDGEHTRIEHAGKLVDTIDSDEVDGVTNSDKIVGLIKSELVDVVKTGGTVVGGSTPINSQKSTSTISSISCKAAKVTSLELYGFNSPKLKFPLFLPSILFTNVATFLKGIAPIS